MRTGSIMPPRDAPDPTKDVASPRLRSKYCPVITIDGPTESAIPTPMKTNGNIIADAKLFMSDVHTELDHTIWGSIVFFMSISALH